LSALLVLTMFSACRTTKYVPENEYLLAKVDVVIDNKEIDKNDLKTYLKQKPNTEIFGFWKFHLNLYNLSSRKKENGWLKRIGEAPVVYSQVQKDKSRIEFQRYLRNKGYYHAEIDDSVVFRKNRKASVIYHITSHNPYLIKSYKAVVKDDSIAPYLSPEALTGSIKVNDLFNTDNLSLESQLLLRNLQNNGFYKANKANIYYEADTTRTKERVDLKLVVEKENVPGVVDSLKLKNHERYTFRNFYYITDNEVQRNQIQNDTINQDEIRDTLIINNNIFILNGELEYKPELLINANHIGDKGYYSVDLVDRTYNEFFSLRLFKLINIRFVETNTTDSIGNPTLDCFIQLTPSLKQSYSVSVEGTNSLGNFGIGGNLGYQHKNLLNGGEIFDVNLLAASEKQRIGSGDSARTFNSLEMGVETRLTIPKFIAPFNSKAFFRFSTPQTFFDLSYNYQRRPDYTRTIVRGSYGYQWKSSEISSHRINLLDLNLVKMFELDSAFVAGIENLYIKSSYIDHSIAAINYAYTLNTQNLQKKSSYKFFRASFETSGNSLYLLSELLNRPTSITDSLSGEQYSFLKTPFAQYFKTDFEFRKGLVPNRFNAFVFRAYGGIAVPYGNSVQMPFERKFFSGGANGIRAWPVRTLGPGSYLADPNEFPNQSGDIKLEANAEYRFSLLGDLEGALFLDMGNIWSLNDNRPGTEFDFARFYKEIAMGSGFGLRYDFSYVIIRFDLGVKVYNPSLTESNRWTPVGQLLNQDNINFAFAIGYPF
jgi:outer membrane protein assembly factor BamA